MNESVARWLLQLALGGGLLLLLTRLVMARLADPGRRQRLGELGLASALLLGVLALAPAWLSITLPDWFSSPAPPVVSESALPSIQPAPGVVVEAAPFDLPEDVAPEAEAAPEKQAAPPARAQAAEPVIPPRAPGWSNQVKPWLVAGYTCLAGWFLLRWLFAHVALAWLLRGARPAPEHVQEVLDELSPRPPARLVVSSRARVPFSFGLLRPTMVLPECLVDAPPRILRWVLAHEQEHVKRRDGCTELLLALGQVAFFYVPWFWWLKRQVRLCQEYVADAAAVAVGGRPEDYAEFLLGWAKAPAAPSPANGVFGSTSDLYRRITMLLQPDSAKGVGRPRGWFVLSGAGLLSLAVLLAGLRLDVGAAAPAAAADKSAREDKKDEKKPTPPPGGKKEEPKKDEKDKGGKLVKPALPDIDKLLERLPEGTDPKQIEELRKTLERMRQQMERQAELLQKQLDRQAEAMRKQMELQAEARRRMIEGQLGRAPRLGRRLEGTQDIRLGTLVKTPEPALVAQLDLPKDQGLVLAEIGPNSPAAKAGLKRHDVLLELNGKPVSSKVEDFARQLAEVKPATPVDAVVLRKGKKETVKGLTLPEARPETPRRPGRRGIGRDRLLDGIDKLVK
jgi:Zn-dependent protease with chaperone function